MFTFSFNWFRKTKMATEEADTRHDEIVLDHALAKSSNVSSPQDTASISASASASPKPPRPPVLNQLKHQDTNIEDDFFSMSYTPMYSEVKKKKKKKKVKKSVDSVNGTPTSSVRTPVNDKVDGTDVIELGLDGDKNERDDSLIMIDNHQGPIKENPASSIKRSITPPLMDEETFKRVYKQQKLQSYDNLEFEEPNEVDLQLKKRLALLDTISTSRPSSSDSNKLEVNEKPIRTYELEVVSYLPGSEELPPIDLTVKGNKQLRSIIKKVLIYYKSLDVISDMALPLFEEESVVLYWGKMKLMSFMKLDSLGISEHEDKVQLVLYSDSQSDLIEERENISKRERLEQQKKDEELEKLLAKNKESQQEIEEIDDDLTNLPITLQQEEQESSEYFKIGLKGEDNKKLIVEVSPTSKIIDVVKHYLKTKSLPESTKVKLVFDDEELEISGTIADTELEEDFTVDVYILK